MMADIKIALVGAGSRSFGPSTIRDILLSPELGKRGVHLALVDIAKPALAEVERYARLVAKKKGGKARISATTKLNPALAGADFVVTAIEVNRFLYWSQDFHIPRKLGFRQVYGENGGPGGLFHALRNMGPMIGIARAMEKLCPKAPLLNFTNPEAKLCEGISRLTGIKSVGLCHGVFMGMWQVCGLLGRPMDSIDFSACGLNHFTWFQSIRDRKTGRDLYPDLTRVERELDPLADWHEMALARVLFRRFGLWPSPAPNHYGEYLGWAAEFVAAELQYFYDPADGEPRKTGVIPEFVYSLTHNPHHRPWRRKQEKPVPLEKSPLKHSGELSALIMESLACGVRHELAAVNVPNRGAMPDLPDSAVVELPAISDSSGLRPVPMKPLPEAIAAMLRLQASINKLLVEAFAEKSKGKLIQAILLDPGTSSYRATVALVDEMLEVQKDLLPALK
jgi:alpha-galactosidase